MTEIPDHLRRRAEEARRKAAGQVEQRRAFLPGFIPGGMEGAIRAAQEAETLAQQEQRHLAELAELREREGYDEFEPELTACDGDGPGDCYVHGPSCLERRARAGGSDDYQSAPGTNTIEGVELTSGMSLHQFGREMYKKEHGAYPEVRYRGHHIELDGMDWIGEDVEIDDFVRQRLTQRAIAEATVIEVKMSPGLYSGLYPVFVYKDRHGTAGVIRLKRLT